MSPISVSLQGMTTAESRLNSTAKHIAADGPSVESSVNLIKARGDAAANTETARTAGEMQRFVIDMYS